MNRICILLMLGLSSPSLLLAQSPGQVLFCDKLASTVTKDAVRYTKADVFPSSDKAPGGQIIGTAEVMSSPAGKAIRLHGRSGIIYAPAKDKIDLTGGEISFRVALNFDPMEKNDKTRTVLRNQSFLDIWDMSNGQTRFSFYNAGRSEFAAAVFNRDRNLVLYPGFQQVWKPSEWHSVSLRWGKEFEIWVDGEKKASKKWNGLFGSLPVDLGKTTIIVGSPTGLGSIDSEFAIADLTIRGPAASQVSGRPRMLVPLLTEEPVIDGKLDDIFWTKAGKVSGFVRFARNELVEHQSVLYTAYSDKGLYFGIEVSLPGTSLPRAMLTEHDAALYMEDSAEVFLQPAGTSPDVYYQFITSARGTKLDAKGEGDKPADRGGYNPDWQVKTTSGPGRWTAEIFIPFEALEHTKRPAPGQVWKANVCIDSSAGFSNAALWSYSPRFFNEPTYFGDLIFTGKERTLRQEKFGGFRTGDPRVAFSLIGDFQPIISIKGEVTDATGKDIYKNSMLLRDTKSIQIKPPYLTTGTYSLVLSGVDETGLEVFYQNLSFQTAKSFDFTLENYPYTGYVQFRADAKGIKGPIGKVVCTILDQNHKQAGVAEITDLKAGQGEGRFPNASLAPGAYTVEANAVGTDGKVLESAKQALTIYPKPDWWNNTLGLDHSVPPPFQPVKATKDGLAVWGREFTFGQGVFPRQIRSRGKDLFRGPPHFELKTEGRSLDLGTLSSTPEETRPDMVTLVGKQAVGKLAVDLKTTVEFDGFMRFDVTLTPAEATKVDELTLAIPLPKDQATLMLNSVGTSSQCLMLDKGYGGAFAPFIWVGNDDLGLSWFSESDEFWRPKDNKMLEVVQGEKEAMLKVNMIRSPLALAKPITISFGLMATPIRPILKNDPCALSYGGDRGNITFSEFLTYPLAKHIRPEKGTLEFWVKASARKANDRITQLFQIAGEKKTLDAAVLPPDSLVLVMDGKRLLTAKAPILSNSFNHLAFTWDKDTLACYVNGRRVQTLTGLAVAEMKEAFVGGNGKITFGAYDDRDGFTAVVLDDLRISDAVRYTGDGFRVPTGPLAGDANALLLDPLDETFKPDGVDAETSGGGVPSIGSVFVAGKFGRGLKMEVAPARPAFAVMKEFGSKITDWSWTPEMVSCYGQPYLYSPVIPGLRDEVMNAHKYGIRVIPYMAYPAISNTSGYIERYGDEWEIKPVSTTPWQLKGSPEGYYFLNCCLGARSYQDYFAAYTVWGMDQFGFDGVYSDGLTQAYPCQNRAHGCGYVDEGGTLHPTWRVFAVRDTLKRMYRIIKAKNPNGMLVNHASFNLIAPILSFSDIVYTGEHEDYENLLTARVRFNSIPWGLYITLLGASDHAWSSLHEMVPLLNGTSVWGLGMTARRDQGRKEYAIRKVYADFNTTTATWIPCYKGENAYYAPADPKFKVSLYYHEGKDILLLAGNLYGEAKTIDLKLDLARMNLRGRPLRAVNALTGRVTPISPDGACPIAVKGKSFILMRIEVPQ